MRCVDPFVKAGEIFPCGRCLPCKFSARRVWFHRLLLEASNHDYTSVVTLTYSEEALPLDGSLHPEHLRDWLKRYRKRRLERYPWGYLRFFACGEYGEKEGRPHYHLVLFGQPGCEGGRGGRSWCGDCSCVTCSDISETWPLGVSSIDSLSIQSAAYVAGYVTRKMGASYVINRKAPFTRMSNRPGIGAHAMDDVASTVLQYGLELPLALRTLSRSLPLGRYLRQRLAARTGREVPSYVPSEALQAVREYARVHCISPSKVLRQINEPFESQLWQKEALREKLL